MRRLLAVVPLMFLGIALAACSPADAAPGVATAGGGSTTASTDPSAPAQDDTERGRQFASCMREHGVDMPDPQPGQQPGKDAIGSSLVDAQKETVMDALDACRAYMPEGRASGPLTPEQLERQRQLAACMRENGVEDFPDPDPNGGAGARQFALDKRDPDLMEALEKCRDVAGPLNGGTREGTPRG